MAIVQLLGKRMCDRCVAAGAVAGLIAALAAGWASGATFTVTNANDSGAGSLRQAIVSSNGAGPGPNIINFNIAGSPPITISPLSALPPVTVPVTIDGTSQTGAVTNTGAFGAADNAVIAIVIDGGAAGAAVDGLAIQNHTGTVIRGLNIRNFSGNGITISGTGGGHTVAGCFIGTDDLGAAAAGNSFNGISVSNANNLIGGPAAADRNVISGNGQSNVYAGVRLTGTGATSNTVEGNYVGTSASGTVAIGNSVTFGYGVIVEGGASNNTIGSSAGVGNVISGNGGGLTIQGGGSTCSGNTVLGNRIGTNTAGSAALANRYDGINNVAYASNTVIGGTTAGAGNLISGNSGNGIGIYGTQSGHVVIEGNYIGTDLNDTTSIPNGGDGIHQVDSGTGNTAMIGGTVPGSANFIAGNTGNGVTVGGGAGTPLDNAILGNSIAGNGKLGIDLGNDGVTPNDPCDADTGPNNLQNFPVLASVTAGPGFVHIVGSLNSTANTTFRLEFFVSGSCSASGYGEGSSFLGTTDVTTDGSCNASIDVVFPDTIAIGGPVTATATDPNNNTSEFSACAAAAAGTLGSTTTVVSSVNPSRVGQSVTFTATVTGAGPIPAGSVAFYDGTTLLGTVTLDAGGQAAYATSALAVGSHQITAHYGGGTVYDPSVSSPLAQVVNAPIPALGAAGLALLACLLAAAGTVALRRLGAG